MGKSTIFFSDLQIWTVAINVASQWLTVDCAVVFPYYSIFFFKENHKTRLELQEMFKQRYKSEGKTSLGKPEGLTSM